MRLRWLILSVALLTTLAYFLAHSIWGGLNQQWEAIEQIKMEAGNPALEACLRDPMQTYVFSSDNIGMCLHLIKSYNPEWYLLSEFKENDALRRNLCRYDGICITIEPMDVFYEFNENKTRGDKK